ncbi:MAG: FixH family protein [Pseudomonadota bacterium]
MQTPNTQPRQFTGRHMLLAMLAFFGVIIIVNLTMATVASRSWTGLVVKNSYVASQAFNRELEQAKLQAARGWTGDITYRDGAVVLSLTDKAGQPVILDSSVVEIGRPAYEQADHQVVMVYQGSGIYHAKDNLQPGIWQVSVRGTSSQGDYRLDSRLIIKADAKQ